MNFSEYFNNAKALAMEAANTASVKAKQVAAIAKANVAILAEEDKVRKAEQQLGKLYYRDYAVGEEMDMAEYLPWCEKIDESKQLIAQLREQIDELKGPEAADVPMDAEVPAAEEADFVTEEAPEAPAEPPVVIELPKEDAE